MIRTINLAIYVLLALGLGSSSVAQRTPSEGDKVRQFVQAFYNWYTPLAVKDPDSVDIVLRTKSAYLTRRLAVALTKDSAAQAKTPGYIVGLDFDPFMNSQDPDESYKVGLVKRMGYTYRVSIHRKINRRILPAVIVIAEVLRIRGRYRFANFFYPEGGRNLLAILKRLAADRVNKGR